jgi:hypothetical protein
MVSILDGSLLRRGPANRPNRSRAPFVESLGTWHVCHVKAPAKSSGGFGKTGAKLASLRAWRRICSLSQAIDGKARCE